MCIASFRHIGARVLAQVSFLTFEPNTPTGRGVAKMNKNPFHHDFTEEKKVKKRRGKEDKEKKERMLQLSGVFQPHLPRGWL